MKEIVPYLYGCSIYEVQESLDEHSFSMVLNLLNLKENPVNYEAVGFSNIDLHEAVKKKDYQAGRFIVNLIEKHIGKQENVLVHCFYGIDRTSLAIGLYLLKTMDVESIVNLLRKKLNPDCFRIPEYLQFLRNFNID